MKKNYLSRRDFVARTGLSLSGAALAGSGITEMFYAKNEPPSSIHGTNGILKKGQVFNESEVFADLATGRKSIRLTKFRKINHHQSYHIFDNYTRDSRYLLLTTRTDDDCTAILRAEIATGEMTVLEVFAKGVWANFILIPAAGKVAVVSGSDIRLIDMYTLKEEVVRSNIAGLIVMAGSIDGTKIFGKRTGAAIDVNGTTVKPVTHLYIDIKSGDIKDIFQESKAQCNHVVPCPSDPDLILIDRDFAPGFGGGSDGKTSRVWILNVKTGKLTEIRPNDLNPFQNHSNWNYNGDYVYYHGASVKHSYPTSPTGHFIGVADKSGKVVWEGHFPKFSYGHVSGHTKMNAVLSDALISRNLIVAFHWQELNSQGLPMIEILGQHDTNWVAGQENHPHPNMSPDGKWICYNRGESSGEFDPLDPQGKGILKNIYGEPVGTASRSDVCVVLVT
jgi:hypothetical protein